jgi:hypothetical protein
MEHAGQWWYSERRPLSLAGSIRDAISGALAKLERTTHAARPDEKKEAALARLKARYVSHIHDLEGMVLFR